MHTFEIFPTVIAKSNYGDFCQSEKKTLIAEKYIPNKFFALSEDTEILNKVPKLKNWIESKLLDYTKNIMRVDNELIITQSWCLMHSGVKQIINPHRHSNSIISGSFYIVAPKSTRGLSFYKNSAENVTEYPLIEWETIAKDKRWLKTVETFDVEENDMILFQSNLSHGVNSDIIMPRLVLAFNTWFKYPIGNRKRLNELKGLCYD